MTAGRVAARIAATIFFLIAAPIQAQTARDLAGSWAIRSGGRTIVLVAVRPDQSRGWSVDITRPVGIGFTEGHMAGGISRMPEHRQLRSIGLGGTAIELKYVKPAPNQVNDIIVLASVAPDFATWGVKGAPFEPLLLVRAKPGEKLDLASWTSESEYPLDEPWPSNPEMTRLFKDDQAARRDGIHTDWLAIAPQDRARREATRRLLDSGVLHSGQDFWHAAHIFQHGTTPQDFLLAHGLAIIAAAKGWRDGAWIAAASFDRYLQAIGQKQVYGTQYKTHPGQPWTQEPYDRTVISDAMRLATGVPPMEWQEKELAEYNRELRPTVAAPRP